MFTQNNPFLVRERILIDDQRPLFRLQILKNNPVSPRTLLFSPFHLCTISLSTLSATAAETRDWGKGQQSISRRQQKKETPGKTLSNSPGNRSVATVCVQSTRNNTILTLIDPSGKARGWTSSGCLGFKNTRKSTTYAAQAAAESLAGKALAFGFLVVRVRVKGVGYGKQSSVRALQKSGLRVVSVEETTPIPYNGCRLPKKRRT